MKICPRCGREYYDFPALSKVDNKTEICSRCGTEEAIEEYFKYKYLHEAKKKH